MSDASVERLDALSFEDRNAELGKMSDEEREAILKAAPPETIKRWVHEEESDLQDRMENQPELSPRDEVVVTPGPPEPVEKPVDDGLIKGLVMERIEFQQAALAAETKLKLVEAKATEYAAELQAYYEAFGPLPESE